MATEHYSMREEEGSCEESAACSASSIGFRQQPLTTLKKDCPTRWNCFVVHAGECCEESRVG